MEKFRIRDIEPGDDTTLAAIIRNALKEHGANKPGTVYFDESTDHLSRLFETKRSAYFVLEVDGDVAGGAGYFPTNGLADDTCEMVKMYLAPGYRGKGLGHSLLNHCIAKAKENGYTKMYIETMPELKKAIALYKLFGFEELKSPMGNSCHTGCDIWMMRQL